MSPSAATDSTKENAGSYVGSLYLLPSDDEERQRLLKQHRLYTRLLSDRLFLPPISFSDKDEVLDIGTGGGAWLCDARTHLPGSVQLYGIDIESRLFPGYTTISPNVHLSVCSATDLPSYWTSKFTLVHQRLMICAYTRDQWQRAIDEMFRVLKPGGYAQLIEPGPECVSGPKTAVHALWMDRFFWDRDMLMRCVVYIADMMKVAGFVDVTSEEVIMHLGERAGEEGVQARDIAIGAWRGMQNPVMRAGGFGRFASAEDFNKALDEIAAEWDEIEDSRMAVRVFYGRKPL